MADMRIPGGYAPQIPVQPAYGLAGANAALAGASYGTVPNARQQEAMVGYNANPTMRTSSGGLRVSTPSGGPIDFNRDLAMQQATTGINALNPWTQQGQQANQSQAALSGALGQQAQQQAYAAFQSSPGQQWLQEQAERGLLRNSAAIGGLGGGNVRQALQAQAMGLAQQDFQNNYARLGNVADRGMQGAQLQTSLYDMAGNAASAAGGQHANVMSSGIQAGAQMSAAQTAANASMMNTRINADAAAARDRALYAFQAGQNIGTNYNSTTSALANLANQQGSGRSDMFGNYTGNIANLLTGAGSSQATSNANLAALLGNLGTGASSNIAGLPGIPGVSQSSGILGSIGNALSGAGQAVSGYGALATLFPAQGRPYQAMAH